MKTTLAALAILATTPVIAEPYFAINLASKHFNASRDFNEMNIGVSIGYRWGNDQFRYGISGGVFLNSYEHWASYATAEADFRIINTGFADVYAGAFIGFAGYPNLVGYAQDKGIPTLFGTHVMVAGPSISIALERGPEIVTRCLIGGDKMDAVCSVSLRFEFGGN